MRYLIVGVFLLLTVGFFVSFRKKPDLDHSNSVRQVKVLTVKEQSESDIRHALDKASSYEKAGEMEMAVRTWTKVVKDHPDAKEGSKALFLLMKVYIEKKQHALVNLYFKKLSEKFKDSAIFPQALYDYARYLRSEDELILARKYYRTLMKDFLFFEKRSEIEKELELLNVELLFSGHIIQGTRMYTVKKGDSLSAIADRFHTTVDFLIKTNHLDTDSLIHPGDSLKVLDPNTKITLSIDKSQQVMLLLWNGEVFSRYSIAIGHDNKTPVGKFSVQNKLKDPVWFHSGEIISSDDPRNVLGSRWIGFDRDLGIHGTVDPRDIILQTSNGCVRMTNRDVEQIYTLLRVGDSVVIVD